MPRWIHPVITVLMVLWPLLLWVASRTGHTDLLWTMLAILFALQSVWRTVHRQFWPWDAGMSLGGCVLASSALLLDSATFMLYYPVIVSAGFFVIFGQSLIRPPSIIERLARLREPNLPPKGVAYTRRVTQVWCVFFVINGSIALGTVLYGDMDLWTLWNGCLSYLAMGLLFAAEWLYRQRYL